MRRWLTSSALLVVVLVLGVISLSFAQGGGGAFVPSFSYIVSGQWTWSRTTTPWVIKPAGLVGGYAISFAYTTPTANRTITIPNATGTLMLTASTSANRVVAGTANVSGTNPYSVTTGLSSLVACSVTLNTATLNVAPGGGTYTLSTILTSTAGRLDIYRWGSAGGVTTDAREIKYICAGA